jgi:chain length determinant protein tyrosine kinase EpsG
MKTDVPPPSLDVGLIPGVVARIEGRDSERLRRGGPDDDTIATERLIGSILSTKVALGPDDIDQILTYARSHGVRFGDAAVALGLVTQDQVLQSLADQFGYQYAGEERRKLMPELVGLNQPFSLQAEAVREIRSQVLMRVFNAPTRPRPALAVVSPNSGDGKTFLSANLAVALAQIGSRTLLVDADLRGPRLHEVFRLDNTTGLSSLLAGHVDSNVIQQVPDTENLFVMPVGATPPNPLELIERPAFKMLLMELTSNFDHVVVDTPAAIYGVDAQVIAARCGAALVMARKNESRVGALQKFVATLTDSSARIAGVIMNDY